MKRLILGTALLLCGASASAETADIYPSAIQSLASPSVVLLQGANVDKSEYSLFSQALAKMGFHVIVANVFRRVEGVEKPGLFALEETVADSFEVLRKENSDPASLLFGRVDLARLAVVGHSFGGMAALLAVDGRCLAPYCETSYRRPPALQAAVVLGTSTYWQGNYFPVNTQAMPVALVSGELDSGAPPAAVSGTFDHISAPKAWLQIPRANHFAMTNQNPSPGAKPDPRPQPIPQSESIAISARWTGLFLQAFVRGDASARQAISQEATRAELSPR